MISGDIKSGQWRRSQAEPAITCTKNSSPDHCRVTGRMNFRAARIGRRCKRHSAAGIRFSKKFKLPKQRRTAGGMHSALKKNSFDERAGI